MILPQSFFYIHQVLFLSSCLKMALPASSIYSYASSLAQLPSSVICLATRIQPAATLACHVLGSQFLSINKAVYHLCSNHYFCIYLYCFTSQQLLTCICLLTLQSQYTQSSTSVNNIYQLENLIIKKGFSGVEPHPLLGDHTFV